MMVHSEYILLNFAFTLKENFSPELVRGLKNKCHSMVFHCEGMNPTALYT